MEDWPFDQARNVAAVTNAAVLEGAPILLVVHYSDDDSWAFLDGSAFDDSAGRIIGMGEAVHIDPSLKDVADLRPGWVARRTQVGGPWRHEIDGDV